MNIFLQTAYFFYLESHKKRQIICMIKISTASSFILFFYITLLHLYSFSLTNKTELNSDEVKVCTELGFNKTSTGCSKLNQPC